jgi:hypothetical protein
VHVGRAVHYVRACLKWLLHARILDPWMRRRAVAAAICGTLSLDMSWPADSGG